MDLSNMMMTTIYMKRLRDASMEEEDIEIEDEISGSGKTSEIWRDSKEEKKGKS